MCASRQCRSAGGEDGPLVRGVLDTEPQPSTVLVVDDEPDVASLTAAYLKRLETDVRVLVETHPRDALALYEEVAADCVVSDFEMPAMDGLAVADAVRERDPAVPVLLFSATDDESVPTRARTRGVRFVRKGRNGFDELASRVEGVLTDAAVDCVADRGVGNES